MITPVSKLERTVDPDYEIDTRSWQKTAYSIGKFVLQIILFPWGLYELTRYITQRILMAFLYPAQSQIRKWQWPEWLSSQHLDQSIQPDLELLVAEQFIVRRVALKRDGTTYDGLLIGKREFIHNKHWVLHATGNFCPIELVAATTARIYAEIQYNTLLVNGPCVGYSQGHANPQTMGEVQDLALSYLENDIQAERIIITGHSLGGAAIGLMIPTHNFQQQIKYLVIRQMTFDRADNVAAKVDMPFLPSRFMTRHLVRWAGLAIDSVHASKILEQKQIPEIIVQATHSSFSSNKIPAKEQIAHDSIIPAKGTLAYRLLKEKILTHKTFVSFLGGTHSNAYIPKMTIPHILEWERTSSDLPIRKDLNTKMTLCTVKKPNHADLVKKSEIVS